jgi:hypothetical protein
MLNISDVTDGSGLPFSFLTLQCPEGRIVGPPANSFEIFRKTIHLTQSDFLGEVLTQYYTTDYVRSNTRCADYRDRAVLEQA